MCLYYTKLEPIFKINSRYIPQGKALTHEYARVLAKRESGNVQMIRTPPQTNLGEWRRSAECKCGLARAEEGSGEESARASAFLFF